jgi:hypothetical protein
LAFARIHRGATGRNLPFHPPKLKALSAHIARLQWLLFINRPHDRPDRPDRPTWQNQQVFDGRQISIWAVDQNHEYLSEGLREIFDRGRSLNAWRFVWPMSHPYFITIRNLHSKANNSP